MCLQTHMNSRWSRVLSHKGGIGAQARPNPARLRKVVAADCANGRMPDWWDRRDRCFGHNSPPARFNKGQQDCERQNVVNGVLSAVISQPRCCLRRDNHGGAYSAYMTAAGVRSGIHMPERPPSAQDFGSTIAPQEKSHGPSSKTRHPSGLCLCEGLDGGQRGMADDGQPGPVPAGGTLYARSGAEMAGEAWTYLRFEIDMSALRIRAGAERDARCICCPINRLRA
jgi:hypothetical protein